MKSVFFHLAAISVNLFVSNVFILFISLSLYIHQCSVHTKRNTLKTPLSLDLRYWNFEAPQKKKKKNDVLSCSSTKHWNRFLHLYPIISLHICLFIKLSPLLISPLWPSISFSIFKILFLFPPPPSVALRLSILCISSYIVKICVISEIDFYMLNIKTIVKYMQYSCPAAQKRKHYNSVNSDFVLDARCRVGDIQ